VTVHVISVGVSLRDSLADPRKSLAKRKVLAGEVQDLAPQRLLAKQGISDGNAASDWLSHALTPAGSPERDDSTADGLAELAARVRTDLWPDDISAELGTFARVPGAGRPLGRKDIAILVSSDTADGLVAGLWNAVALAGGDLGRVRFLAAPEQPGDPRGKVTLVRVPGLDAGDEQGFCRAMRGLGLLGHNLLGAKGVHQGEPFRFYLSGGFKAAIPYLIGLAEGLRSLDPERDVAAYVLHEATKSAAIRLPLRWLMADWVREELGGFGDDDGMSRVKPADPLLLDGYGYQRDGKVWRLTAFGEGLRALFGLAGREGLGK
jgi:hypothetical protein